MLPVAGSEFGNLVEMGGLRRSLRCWAVARFRRYPETAVDDHVDREKSNLDEIGVCGDKLIELGGRGLADLPVQEFSFAQHDTNQAQRLVGPTLEVAGIVMPRIRPSSNRNRDSMMLCTECALAPSSFWKS
jgi:hypothetical protein